MGVHLVSCGGALTHFPSKLGLKNFFHRPGSAGAPTAPPGYAYDRKLLIFTLILGVICVGVLWHALSDDQWTLYRVGQLK